MTVTSLTHALRRAWRSLDLSLRVLNHLQFDAPWQARRRGC